MKSDKGFIRLHRSVLNNPLWNEDRPNTKAEAWLDLLMSAWYSDEDAKVIVGNKTLTYSRGEVYASLRFLGESWKWSKNKVDGFLTYLQNEGMITKRTDKGTGRTILTICKYDVYNPKSEFKGQTTGREKDSIGTAQGQHRDSTGTNKNKDNKYNKVNKEEESKIIFARDEILENSILDFFGFTETRNFDKARIVRDFVICLKKSEKLDEFKNQFDAYQEYKKVSGTHKHSFLKFLGNHSDLFLDGAWNAENWQLKLQEEQSKNQLKSSKFTPPQSTRGIEAAMKIMNVKMRN